MRCFAFGYINTLFITTILFPDPSPVLWGQVFWTPVTPLPILYLIFAIKMRFSWYFLPLAPSLAPGKVGLGYCKSRHFIGSWHSCTINTAQLSCDEGNLVNLGECSRRRSLQYPLPPGFAGFHTRGCLSEEMNAAPQPPPRHATRWSANLKGLSVRFCSSGGKIGSLCERGMRAFMPR